MRRNKIMARPERTPNPKVLNIKHILNEIASEDRANFERCHSPNSLSRSKCDELFAGYFIYTYILSR